MWFYAVRRYSMKQLFWLLFFPTWLTAQSVEFGAGAGFSFYYGDISVPRFVENINQSHTAYHLFGKYHITNFFAAHLGITSAKVSASDELSNLDWQQNRNLQFESHILEIGLRGELDILGLHGLDRFKYSPYLFAGIAYFRFNPKAEYEGQLIELQPLGTEGQGMPNYPNKYNLNAISIPFGLGVAIHLTEHINVGIEFGWRKTSTDYLDDASTNYVSGAELSQFNGQAAADLGNKIQATTGTKRANPSVLDWYQIGLATISYTFGDGRGFGVGTKGYKGNCPSEF